MKDHYTKFDDFNNENGTITFRCTYYKQGQTTPVYSVLLTASVQLDVEAFELLGVEVLEVFDYYSGHDVFLYLPQPIRELLNKHLMDVFDLKEEVLCFVQRNMDGRYIF